MGRNIGKLTLLPFSATDITKCIQFRLLAQQGACSSWHIDQNGVYTFVTLEGNIDDCEPTEDVVKYWPVFPMYHYGDEEKDAFREELL